MNRFYTGVGSRETPTVVLDLMRELARILASKGMTLRSGAADGADQAFELGWLDWYLNQTESRGFGKQRAELYLPWDGFNKHDRDGCFGANLVPEKDDAKLWAKAREIAMQIHPAFEKCSRGAQALHTRNVYQVLGKDLDSPSKFLVGYAPLTKGGKPKGGTATAMNLADQYGVKVYNLYIHENFKRFEDYVRENQ